MRVWPERASMILGNPRFVVLGIFAYVLLHAAVRFMLSPTLGIDDAEQALYAQSLAGGYGFRQPPLYTWLLIAVSKVFGHNLAAHTILRYLLQFLCFLFLYLAARKFAADGRCAALCLLSYLLFYTIAFYNHHDLTHTNLLAAAIAASAYFYARVVESGRLRDCALLGLALAAGMLAKYNFAVFAAAGLIATISSPEARRRMSRSGIFLMLLVGIAVTSPHLYWLINHGFEPLASAEKLVDADAAGAGLWLRVRSVGLTFLKTLEYLSLPVLGALAIPELFRWTAVRKNDPFEYRKILGRVIVIGMLAIAVLFFLLAAEKVKARWFHVPLFIVPLWAFARLSGAPAWSRARNYLLVVACASLVALGARFAMNEFGPNRCSNCRQFIPVSAIAEELKARGFTGGAILADGHDMAGNLRIPFPGSLVRAPRNFLQELPSPGEVGDCLIIWRGQPDDVPPALAMRLEEGRIGQEIPAIRTISKPLIGAPARNFQVSYVLIKGKNQCWDRFGGNRKTKNEQPEKPL